MGVGGEGDMREKEREGRLLGEVGGREGVGGG